MENRFELSFSQKDRIDVKIFGIRSEIIRPDGCPIDPDLLEKSLELARKGIFPGLTKNKWHREGDSIHFTVISNGWTGLAWVIYFELNDILIGTIVREMLLSPDYRPSDKGRPYDLDIRKSKIFPDEKSITETAFRGFNNGFSKPLEMICSIRKIFTEDDIKDMGFSRIVSMHGNGVYSYVQGPWVNALMGKPDYVPLNCGFVHAS